jgi:hypothetical protein
MKTVNLEKEEIKLEELTDMATDEPLLIITNKGEFILSQADDFEQEVELLRDSQSFQKFLEERSKSKVRIPLSEIEKEIDEELLKK